MIVRLTASSALRDFLSGDFMVPLFALAAAACLVAVLVAAALGFRGESPNRNAVVDDRQRIGEFVPVPRSDMFVTDSRGLNKYGERYVTTTPKARIPPWPTTDLSKFDGVGAYWGDISSCYVRDTQLQPTNPTVKLPSVGRPAPNREEMMCRCRNMEPGTTKTLQEMIAKRNAWEKCTFSKDSAYDDAAPSVLNQSVSGAIGIIRNRHKIRNPIAILKGGPRSGSQTVNFDSNYVYFFTSGDRVTYAIYADEIGFLIRHDGLVRIVA